ncbi:MAG TPA: methyltransferase domain-containing protein [Vicinamibacterales bacterium]|nr:methyltransferase domain-containing protein [Vicinamibacterales bacterium]
MSFEHVDFAELYRSDPGVISRAEHPPEFWDGRAAGFGERAARSEYGRQFVERMDLDGCSTLLDVGCGPGTIALAVAGRLERVYGLDYSPRMLDAFSERAKAAGHSNATPILRAWADDWSDVPVCDVVVASRATAVRDFEAAARKLDAVAARRVYLTYPAFGTFAGDGIRRALGRPHHPLPDYLHIVGILHHLGMHPRLDYITEKGRFDGCEGFEAVVGKVRGLTGDLSGAEADVVRQYYETHRGELAAERMRWAFISWDAAPRR